MNVRAPCQRACKIGLWKSSKEGLLIDAVQDAKDSIDSIQAIAFVSEVSHWKAGYKSPIDLLEGDDIGPPQLLSINTDVKSGSKDWKDIGDLQECIFMPDTLIAFP